MMPGLRNRLHVFIAVVWAMFTVSLATWWLVFGLQQAEAGYVPAHKTDSPDGAMGEGIAIDAAGNLYTAEANLRGVTKYTK